eukprot:GFUD01008233.1.p1 GENE.GFUD01008233.1~~GFUD01008233.1.p1  ORF type:complete len:447 (+),score=136.67 GFUD01008233.1:95-1435(+)
MPKTKKTSKESHRISTSKPSKKRLRVQTSADEYLAENDSDNEAGLGAVARPGRSEGARVRGHKGVEGGEKTKNEVEVRKIRQKLRRAEAEKKKFEDKLLSKRNQLTLEREKVSISERKIEKLKKDSSKLKKTNEKLVKDKDDVLKESKEDNAKWRKKVDSLKQRTASLELERAKLESKISSLSLCGDPEAGTSGGAAGGTGLFQDMMDNFRELAETQLQCAVCSELFVEATAISCGHTFCNYCISEWKKKKANCPVCRTDIKQSVQCKVLDEYADKLYDQFVGEGGKLQRKTLKEERTKIKKDQEVANAAKAQDRRDRAQARRTNDLEMVNIVLNRARRNDDDDSSLDSDATLELHLSDGGGQLSEPDFDTDSSLSVAYDDPSSDLNISTNNISDIFNDSRFDSDTDSSDEEFQTRHNDTDSVSDSTESDTSPSSSDTSSDSDSDF